MTPLAGSGVVHVTLIESDERGTAETFRGADGAEEMVTESHNKSWRIRVIPQYQESQDRSLHT